MPGLPRRNRLPRLCGRTLLRCFSFKPNDAGTTILVSWCRAWFAILHSRAWPRIQQLIPGIRRWRHSHQLWGNSDSRHVGLCEVCQQSAATGYRGWAYRKPVATKLQPSVENLLSGAARVLISPILGFLKPGRARTVCATSVADAMPARFLATRAEGGWPPRGGSNSSAGSRVLSRAGGRRWLGLRFNVRAIQPTRDRIWQRQAVPGC